MMMNKDNINTTAVRKPDLVKTIDKTTYHVKVHFIKTGRESMKDKIKRMLRDEARRI